MSPHLFFKVKRLQFLYNRKKLFLAFKDYMDFGSVKLEQGKLGLTAGVHLRRCIAVGFL